MSEYVMEVEYDIMHGTFSQKRKDEIVRCRDCASFREKDWRCTSFQWHNCDESPDVEPDGFCAWAERREQ